MFVLNHIYFFFAPTSTRFFNDVDEVCLRMLLLLVVRKGSHKDYFRYVPYYLYSIRINLTGSR